MAMAMESPRMALTGDFAIPDEADLAALEKNAGSNVMLQRRMRMFKAAGKATMIMNRLRADSAESMGRHKSDDSVCTVLEPTPEDEVTQDLSEGRQSQSGSRRLSLKGSARAIALQSRISKAGKKEGDARRGHSSIFDSKASLRLGVESILKTLPVFALCCEEFVQKLAARALPVNVPFGDTVIAEGEPGNSFFLVLRGTLRVMIQDTYLFSLARGSWFGEANFFGLDPHWRTTIVAEESVRIVELRQDSFHHVLRGFPVERDFFHDSLSELSQVKSNGTIHHPIPLFAGMNVEALTLVDEILVHRIYFPQEVILDNMTPTAEALLILVSGTVRVEIAGRAARTEKCGNSDEDWQQSASVVYTGDSMPVCFGETEFLGLHRAQNVTLMSQSCCFIRALHRGFRNFLLKALRWPEFRTDAWKRTGTTPASVDEVANYFSEARCSDSFIKFVYDHLEHRIFFPGQHIADSRGGDHVFFCQLGEVDVYENAEVVSTLEAGSDFGEMAVVGSIHKGNFTFVAKSVCFLKIMYQTVVVRALELFPDERREVLNLAFRKMKKNSNESAHVDHDHTDASYLQRLTDSNSGLLASMSKAFVEELRAVADDRIYMPQELIIREGDRGESMFIMVSGKACIYVADSSKCAGEGLTTAADPNQEGRAPNEEDRNGAFDAKSSIKVGELLPGGIVGEMAMLGVAPIRTATIQAETFCVLWEIRGERALELLQEYPKERAAFGNLIVSHLERTVPSRILNMKLFKDFDRNFRMLIGLYCERKAFFPSMVVVREGEVGDKLLIMNLGTAELIKKGFCIKMYSPGNYMGAGNMLGTIKTYCCTLAAISMAHVLCITRSALLQTLEKYPAPKSFQDLKVSQEIVEKQLRELAERVTARMMIIKKYQLQDDEERNAKEIRKTIAPSAEPGLGLLGQTMGNATSQGGAPRRTRQTPEDFNIFSLSGLDLITLVTQTWRTFARSRIEMRRKREEGRARYTKMLENWKLKKSEENRKLHPKRVMNKLVQHNLGSRGPMLLPQQIPYGELPSTMHGHEISAAVAAAATRSRGFTPFGQRKERESLTLPVSQPDSTREFVGLLSDWPAPKQSPHYRLRVWDVLADKVGQEEHSATPLLPLLVSSCSPPPPETTSAASAYDVHANSNITTPTPSQTPSQMDCESEIKSVEISTSQPLKGVLHASGALKFISKSSLRSQEFGRQISGKVCIAETTDADVIIDDERSSASSSTNHDENENTSQVSFGSDSSENSGSEESRLLIERFQRKTAANRKYSQALCSLDPDNSPKSQRLGVASVTANVLLAKGAAKQLGASKQFNTIGLSAAEKKAMAYATRRSGFALLPPDLMSGSPPNSRPSSAGLKNREVQGRVMHHTWEGASSRASTQQRRSVAFRSDESL